MQSFSDLDLRAHEDIGGWDLLRGLKRQARSEFGASSTVTPEMLHFISKTLELAR